MKKGLLLLSLLVLMNFMAVQAAEEPQISVFLNAQRVEFPDQQPALVSDRTLVPLRAIFEAYGCMVEWSDNAAYAACAMPGRVRVLQIVEGKQEIVVRDFTVENGQHKTVQSQIALDVPAQNINNRIMVPLRAVSEALDAEVIWNGITSSVNIFYDKDKIYGLEQQNQYISEHYIKAQHILLEGTDAGKRKGEIIINQIKAGTNFEALMYEHNLDGGVAEYPEGYVFTTGETEQAFEAAAFSLKVGEVTEEPVKTSLGYHVIRRVALSQEDYELVRFEAMQAMALGQ